MKTNKHKQKVAQKFYKHKQNAQGNYKRYPNAVASMNDTLKVMKGLVPTHITYLPRGYFS
jgi:hypothetical protein